MEHQQTYSLTRSHSHNPDYPAKTPTTPCKILDLSLQQIKL